MATEIPVKVTADTKSAERDIKRLQGALESLDQASAGIAAGLAAVTAAAAGMGAAILSTLNSAGQLIDAANAIGISVQSLQSLEHAAATAGVSAEELTGSLIRMTNNLGSGFASGTGPAVDAMTKLGIPMREIMGMRADQQFARIAEEVNKITNPAERNAVAIDLLGKQGPKLLAVAANTAHAAKEMEAMGLALKDIDVARLDMAGDSVDELYGIFKAGVLKAVADVSIYVIALADYIKKAVEEAGGFDAIWKNIKETIKTALNIAAFAAISLIIIKMVQGVIALNLAIKAAGGAMALFNAVVLRNPLMLAVAAALLLAKVLGFDVVGAIGDALLPTLDLEAATAKTAEKAQKIKEENEAQLTVKNELNKKEKEALDALTETIAKLQVSAQYQRDILSYGEQEANVRKVINEEAAKLAKAGQTINEQQKASLRAAIEEEASAKRQIALRNEQAAILQNMLMNQSKLTTELNKLSDIKLSFEFGLDQKSIEEARRQMLLATDPNGEKAMSNQRKVINDTINAELGKYDRLILADQEYQKAKADLNMISEMNRLNQVQLTDSQIASLKAAELQLERDYALEKVKIAEETSAKLLQLEVDRISRVLQAQQGAAAQALSTADQETLQKIGQQERQKAIVAERIAFEKKSEVEKVAFGIDQGAQLFSALGAQNKKAFEIAKAFNIANAIMNTYMAATKALATYPPPFNFIAAAAAVGMGLAQVAQIRSQQYSGRALGGPVMGGQTYMVGESGPELFTPNTTGSITRNGDLQGSQPVSVNFTIVANDTQGFDQLLTSRKGVIQQIISDAMLERGQRSTM